MRVPEVQYTDANGVNIAWMEWGSGPNLVIAPALVSHIEITWEHEFYRRINEFFGQHCRVVAFDKRGVGLSDRYEQTPTLEQRIGDISAVMDAAGMESAVVLGASESGLMAQLFAARHPERVDKLVLLNSAGGDTIFAETMSIADSDELFARFDTCFSAWGRDARPFIEFFSPSLLDNESFIRWSERFQRLSATEKDMRRQLASIAGLDAYADLPNIAAPALVANCARDRVVDPRTGDLLAERIPGATRILFDTDDHFFWVAGDWLAPSVTVLEFITGAAVSTPAERRLATVVFTDIVQSTATAAAAGDDAWRRLLDEHDRIGWATCDGNNGTMVKSTGDGFLARFDMPNDGVRFAAELRDALAEIGLPIRAGVHTGEIEIRSNQDITGMAVNIAARVEQTAGDGAVFASSTVRDMLLGGAAQFAERGEHDLKGIDGSWRLYELTSV